MPPAADRGDNDEATEPDNLGNVSDERASDDVGNISLDRGWGQLSDDVEILSYSNPVGNVVLAIFPQAFIQGE